MKGSVMRDKSMLFAIDIVNLCKELQEKKRIYYL